MKAALFDAGDTIMHQWVPKQERFCWLCEQAALPIPADAAVRRRAAVAAERLFAFRFGRHLRRTRADAVHRLRRRLHRLRKTETRSIFHHVLEHEDRPCEHRVRRLGEIVNLCDRS